MEQIIQLVQYVISLLGALLEIARWPIEQFIGIETWEKFWLWIIIIATVWEARGEVLQGRQIWKARSANKIPVDAYAIDVGTFAATFLWGSFLGLGAYIFNGIATGLALLWVLVGAWKYGTVTNRDKMTVVSVVAIIGMMVAALIYNAQSASEWAGWVITTGMSLFLIYTMRSEWRKLKELSKGEGTGDVVLETNNTWLITNAMFIFYSIGAGDVLFFVCCIVYVVIQSSIFVIFCRKSHTTVRAVTKAYFQRQYRKVFGISA